MRWTCSTLAPAYLHCVVSSVALCFMLPLRASLDLYCLAVQ